MARLTLDQIMQMAQMPSASQLTNAGYYQTGDGWAMGDSEGGERMLTPEDYASIFEAYGGQSDALREQGVLGISDVINPDTVNWFNQNQGTNFGGVNDYLNYIYGGGEQVGDYWVLPEGQSYDQYANTPLNYVGPQSFGDKFVLPALMGLAGAGLTGMLPGTTNVFSSAPSFAGGASGGTIAGGAGGGGALAGGGLTAAETAALGGAASGAGGFVGGASGGGLAGGGGMTGGAGGEFLGGATGGEIAGGATGGALSGAGGAAVTGATQGATSALGRILGGTATSDDWLSVLGGAGSSLLGVLGSNAQADAYGDVASQYLGLGAPFREKLLQSYAPGFSMADQPDFQNAMDASAQAAARATSARVGNPVDNPGAYAEMQKYITGSLALPQLNTYRSQLGSFGQLGTNTAGTASMGEASQAGGMYNALGYGLGQMTRPQNQNTGLLNQMLLNSGFSF